MKCSYCRDNEMELIGPWGMFKNWLFYKLFAEEICDLSQTKYTQGFGDGLEKGRQFEKDHNKLLVKQLYNIDL